MSRQFFPLQFNQVQLDRRVRQLVQGVYVVLFAPCQNEPEPVTVKAQSVRREAPGLTVKQEKIVGVG